MDQKNKHSNGLSSLEMTPRHRELLAEAAKIDVEEIRRAFDKFGEALAPYRDFLLGTRKDREWPTATRTALTVS